MVKQLPKRGMWEGVERGRKLWNLWGRGGGDGEK